MTAELRFGVAALVLLILSGCQQSVETDWHYNRWNDEPKTPFRVLRTGHKLIRALTQPARKVKGVEHPKQYLVEWGWFMEVENKTDDDLVVAITFKLIDKDQFEVSTSAGSLRSGLFMGSNEFRLGPKQRTTFRGTDDGDRDKCKRAVDHRFTYRWEKVGARQ